MDLLAQTDKAPRKVSWGPWEFAQTLAKAADHMQKLQEKDFVLSATLKNQLLAFRFDEQGNRIVVDDDPTLVAAGLKRQLPTRGLKSAQCEKHVKNLQACGPEGPPKPDWTKLDNLGDFRQVAPPQEPDNPEDCLDIPLAQLDLTEDQKFMLRPIEEIHGNPLKSIEIHGHPWKSMEILGNLWKSMEGHGNPWTPWEIYGNPWKSIEIH